MAPHQFGLQSEHLSPSSIWGNFGPTGQNEADGRHSAVTASQWFLWALHLLADRLSGREIRGRRPSRGVCSVTPGRAALAQSRVRPHGP